MRRLTFVFFLYCILFSNTACLAAGLVSLAPNITETLFALGAGDSVVAVSDFCVYPPEVAKLPRVGGKWNPNIEALARLEPGMVFIQGEQDSVARWCRARGITLVRVDMDSLATIRAGIGTIAAAVGREEQGRELVGSLQSDLDAVSRAVSGLPRPRVFLALGGEAGTGGLFTAGQSFLGELLDIAGGENIFADVQRAYSDVSLESLLHRRPDAILDFRPGEDPANVDPGGWQRLIGPGSRIILLTQDFLLLPGPRAGLSARELARAIHPEAGL